MRRSAFFALTAIVALTVFFSPFGRDLFVGDETKYSQVVHEMRDAHSYLVPLLNGGPYTHKPPVHFWGIVALTQLFGFQSIWPFVLQSLLAYLALIAVVTLLARDLFGEEARAPSAFVFASSILPWGVAQTARMDASFTLFITLAALFVWRFLRLRDFRNLYFAAGMIGIAILIKGPMAFVMILILLIIEMVRRRSAPRGWGWLGAFAIAVAIPLLWLVPALIKGGSQYAHDLLIKQNVERAVNAWVHKEPIWYYVLHSPATFFPWSIIAVIGVIALLRRSKEDPALRDSVMFCLSWIAAVVVPFSLLSSKLDVYMLPAIPPMALLVGSFLANGEERDQRRVVIANRIVALFLLLVMVALLVAVGSGRLPASPEISLMAPKVPMFAGFSAVMIAVAFAVMWRGDIATLFRRSSAALAVAALAPLVVAATLLMPEINEISSTRPLIRTLASAGPPHDIALFACPNLWSRDMPSELFDVRYVGDEVLNRAAGPLPAVVATRRSRAKDLGAELAAYQHVANVRMIGKDFDVYRRR